MSDMTQNPSEQASRFHLGEPERWEALGFDWAGWNEAVERILHQQAAQVAESRD